MRTIKTYRKVGAFYIACEEDLSTPIRFEPNQLAEMRIFRVGALGPSVANWAMRAGWAPAMNSVAADIRS